MEGKDTETNENGHARLGDERSLWSRSTGEENEVISFFPPPAKGFRTFWTRNDTTD